MKIKLIAAVAGLPVLAVTAYGNHHVIQIEQKIGKRCTPEDAEILARYSGFPRGTNGYNTFIENCIA